MLQCDFNKVAKEHLWMAISECTMYLYCEYESKNISF